MFVQSLCMCMVRSCIYYSCWLAVGKSISILYEELQPRILAIVRRKSVIHTAHEVISCNGTQTHACCGCTGYGFKTVGLHHVMGF